MSERIFTLFGEEIVPEQLKAVGRSRAKKKPEENIVPEAAAEVVPVPAAVYEPEMVAEPLIVAEGDAAVEELTIAEHTEPAGLPEKKKREKAIPVNLPDDWQGSKQYYSIGEVADLFKVNTSHIRFWTNEFKLKVRTTRKGDRLYTPEQVKELKTINNLVKERGFTLKGAKTRLNAPEKMEVGTLDLKQSLLQLRNKLLAIKNQLK